MMTMEELKADRKLVNEIDWSMTQEKAIEMYLEWGTGWVRGHDFVSSMGLYEQIFPNQGIVRK